MVSVIAKNPLDTPVQFVKGVGPYVSDLLAKRGIKSVYDLLYCFPFRYVDRRQIDSIRALVPGKDKSIIATVVGMDSRPLGKSRRKILEMVVTDGAGVALVSWFRFNAVYFKKIYPAGKKILITGECQFYRHQKQFVHPEIEEWDETENNASHPIQPVYPLTEGLYQKNIRKIIGQAITQYLEHVEDSPYTVRASGESSLGLKVAIKNIHYPPPEADLAELMECRSRWHQRVIYDEFFYLQLGLALKKQGLKKEVAPALKKSSLQNQAMNLLPFALTTAQKKVIGEIAGDLEQDQPMNRMLQGDVGCGKTLVAFFGALQAIESGYQVAFMAPTEILAQQHYDNLRPLAHKLDISIALMTGSLKASDKKNIVDDLGCGRVQLVLGTHALIQEGVEFKNLGFVVIDEQHRFGVMQRMTLKHKSIKNFVPHTLVMTATPIPRTLAMSLYGDLDVSIIDELPSGRLPVKTYVTTEKMRDKCFALIHEELQKGRQAYFIYPLIEESEKLDLKNAIAMQDEIAKIFSKHRVGLIHGRMKSSDKDQSMDEFKKNKIAILVATTVVEVGVDVPNATVMVIEHAERFGLSQLHQLRGRVGRGSQQSYCLLMMGSRVAPETWDRMVVMEKTNDGFMIAEEDLRLRGPGDFLGTRQHGLPEFRLANLVRDQSLLRAAQKRVHEIMAKDAELLLPEHQVMKQVLKKRWEGRLELGEIG